VAETPNKCKPGEDQAKGEASFLGAPIWAWPLGIVLMGLGFVSLYLLIAMWPSVVNATSSAAQSAGKGAAKVATGATGVSGPTGPTGTGGAAVGSPTFTWFGWTITPGIDVALLILVVLAAAVGSFVHAATLFSTYAGNRKLVVSWIWWYLLRALIGSSLALVFYFAFRGGFLASGTDTKSINPYGVAAISGLVGLFSKQATDKLEEVFTTAFQTKPGAGDDARADSLDTPTVTGPPTIEVDTVELSLTGTSFVEPVQVLVSVGGGQATARPAIFVSNTALKVTLNPEDVREANTELTITVTNPNTKTSPAFVIRVVAAQPPSPPTPPGG